MKRKYAGTEDGGDGVTGGFGTRAAGPSGGEDSPLPAPGRRICVIDLDRGLGGDARATEGEAASIGRLAAAGWLVALATSGSERAAERLAGALGAAGTVVPLPRSRGGAPGDGAARLALLCERVGAGLWDVAVIAALPCDLPLVLEAGTAIALEDAGGRCRAASDAVVPSRRDGGLMRAVEILLEGRLP